MWCTAHIFTSLLYKLFSCFYFCTSLMLPALPPVHTSTLWNPVCSTKPDLVTSDSSFELAFILQAFMADSSWQVILHGMRQSCDDSVDSFSVHMHWASPYLLIATCILVGFWSCIGLDRVHMCLLIFTEICSQDTHIPYSNKVTAHSNIHSAYKIYWFNLRYGSRMLYLWKKIVDITVSAQT